MTKKHQYQNSMLQQGFSLIELMIALTLSTVVIGSVFSAFFNAKQTERLAHSLSRLQESGRFSLDYLAREIRMTGYLGCATAAGVNLNINAVNAPAGGLLGNELIGYEAPATSWWSTTQYDISGTLEIRTPKLGSDIINIKRATRIDGTLTGNLTQNNANITTSGDVTEYVQNNDLVLISDCVNADLFAATNVTITSGETLIVHAVGTDGNTVPQLANIYDDQASLYQFSSISYFVSDTGRDNSRGEPIYALYQANETFDAAEFNSQEIVEGVESMQILYGERSTNGNIDFVKASDVGTWADVTTIKIALMLTSNDSVRQSYDTNSYELLDVTSANTNAGSTASVNTHSEDKRLRQIFTSSTVLRNR